MRKLRRSRIRNRLGSGGAPMLRMTALMDIFSTLLLFLLKSFVADGQAGTVTPGVTLPSSIAQDGPHDAPVVAVTDEFISLEGEVMTRSAEATASDALQVEPLYEALVQLREASDEEERRLVVQGDRGIEFRLLQRVMYTSQIAGYTQVSLAVIQDDAAGRVLHEDTAP
jgi:biopolymer transport protein ExbD